MRKITLIFALLAAFATSCLNEGEYPKEPLFKSDILNYLDQLKSVNDDDGDQKIEALAGSIDLKSVAVHDIRGTEKVLIADVRSFDNLGKADRVLALFFVNQTKIVRSRLVTFANQHQFREYHKLILAILRMDEDKLNYSGKISFYNSLQMLLMQNVIENGKLKSSGLARRDPNHSGSTSRTNSCTEWYLVTTYYYSDGSTETVSEYLYTTCSGCNPDQECDDPNDPYEGGGGGGGGGSTLSFPPNPTNNEEAAFTYPNGKYEVYRYNAATSTWEIVMVVLPPAEIVSSPSNYSFLPLLPWHGQSTLGPNNWVYIYDGFSGNWEGAEKGSGLHNSNLVIICPQTFKFHTVASNWQAAGVLGYRYTIVDFGGPGNSIRANTITFSFEVGFPLNSGLVGQISSAYAQQVAAIAANGAEAYIANHYGSDFFGPGAQSTYGHMFTEKMQEYLNDEIGGINIATVNFGLNTISNVQAQRPKYWDSLIGGCN